MLVTTRIGSLSSLIIAFAYIIYDCVTLIIGKNYVGLGLLLFILFLIVWGHRSNIKRLIEKRENVIDLQDAVNKDIERINKRKQRRLEKENKNLNAEVVVDNNVQTSSKPEENDQIVIEVTEDKTEDKK